MCDSMENYKFDLGVKGLNEKCHPYITSNSLHYTQKFTQKVFLLTFSAANL